MESKESALSGWRFVLEDDTKLDWAGRAMKIRQRKCIESATLKGARVIVTGLTCCGWHFPEVNCVEERMGVQEGVVDSWLGHRLSV